MKVQFFSPHPDDIEIFCGFALLQHAESDEVEVVIAADGDGGTWLRTDAKAKVQQRRIEIQNRFALLPKVSVRWLGVGDGKVSTDATLPQKIRTAMQNFSPQMIYLPECVATDSLYRHPDHLSLGKLTSAEAAEQRIPVLRYYHSRNANVFVHGDKALEQKALTAMRFFKSQYSVLALPPFLLHFIEHLRARKLREWGVQAHTPLAEGFREVRN